MDTSLSDIEVLDSLVEDFSQLPPGIMSQSCELPQITPSKGLDSSHFFLKQRTDGKYNLTQK